MARGTKIEWATASWNPWMGCSKVSEGCLHCYAFRHHPGWVDGELRRTGPAFTNPDRWKEPERIFVCSMSDFFHENAMPEWRQEAWEIMERNRRHVFMLLTKRPHLIRSMLPETWFDEPERWNHIWLGVTVELQKRARRVDTLLSIPAAVRFVSFEPLLGPIEVKWVVGNRDLRQTDFEFVDWVITGGESDPMSPRLDPKLTQWFRDIRDACRDVGVPYFHKQNGGREKDAQDGAWGGRDLDGETWSQLPKAWEDKKPMTLWEEDSE